MMDNVVPSRTIGRVRLNYLLIPLITIAVAVLGSLCTSSGMPWYRTLRLPAFTPPGWVIGSVWTVLYVLATIAALLAWNKPLSAMSRKAVGIAFGANALLNLAWSWVFFANQQIALGVFVAGLLGLSVAVLVSMVYPFSRIAAWLLTPYLAWVCFATYLNVSIWKLNG